MQGGGEILASDTKAGKDLEILVASLRDRMDRREN